jgi:hypothetical protein
MFGGAMNGGADFKDEEMDVEEPKPSKPDPPKKEEEKKKTEQSSKANLNETQIKVELTNRLDSIKLLILLNFLKAEQEKELGNEAYKKKDFDTALKHYNAAIDADPLNMSYLTNKAGKPNTTTSIVLLEIGSFFLSFSCLF